jgi:hypothetical protein
MAPRHRYLSIRLHCVIYQKTVLTSVLIYQATLCHIPEDGTYIGTYLSGYTVSYTRRRYLYRYLSIRLHCVIYQKTVRTFLRQCVSNVVRESGRIPECRRPVQNISLNMFGSHIFSHAVAVNCPRLLEFTCVCVCVCVCGTRVPGVCCRYHRGTLVICLLPVHAASCTFTVLAFWFCAKWPFVESKYSMTRL